MSVDPEPQQVNTKAESAPSLLLRGSSATQQSYLRLHPHHDGQPRKCGVPAACTHARHLAIPKKRAEDEQDPAAGAPVGRREQILSRTANRTPQAQRPSADSTAACSDSPPRQRQVENYSTSCGHTHRGRLRSESHQLISRLLRIICRIGGAAQRRPERGGGASNNSLRALVRRRGRERSGVHRAERNSRVQHRAVAGPLRRLPRRNNGSSLLRHQEVREARNTSVAAPAKGGELVRRVPRLARPPAVVTGHRQA